MNARIWLLSVVALALVCSAVPAQAGLLVSDGFESYSGAATSWYSSGTDNDPGSPWTIDESAQECVQLMRSPLSGSPVFDTPYGSQYLHMYRDAWGTANAWIALDSAAQNAIAANGTMRLEVDAHNMVGLDGWGGNLGISGWNSSPGSWTNRGFDVALRPSGALWMYEGSQTTKVDSAYSANAWQKLTIDVNFTTDRWSISANGNPIASNLQFEAGDLSKVQYILLSTWDYNGTGGRGGWDNLTVTSPIVPEPSAIILLSSGVIGLLAYAWRRRR
jgi:hypothetical protein